MIEDLKKIDFETVFIIAHVVELLSYQICLKMLFTHFSAKR